MPYRMTTMDPGTQLNKTETYDGIKGASDFSHFRAGNPPRLPNEYMHWHAAPAAKGAATVQMLATDCIQKSGSQRTGPWQHGVRDYSKNYGACTFTLAERLRIHFTLCIPTEVAHSLITRSLAHSLCSLIPSYLISPLATASNVFPDSLISRFPREPPCRSSFKQ